jgi:hypothetical protein
VGRTRTSGLRRVVVEVEFVGLSNNFAFSVMATSATHVVGTLQLSAV